MSCKNQYDKTSVAADYKINFELAFVFLCFSFFLNFVVACVYDSIASSLNMEYTLPARQFGGVKAIEFTDNKQCITIVPGQPEADLHNKEESTLGASKHASQDISCENASKPLNPAQKIPSVTEFGATSLPKLDPMPNNDESANSTTDMPPQNPSANDPLSLEVESVNKAPNLEQLRSLLVLHVASFSLF